MKIIFSLKKDITPLYAALNLAFEIFFFFLLTEGNSWPPLFLSSRTELRTLVFLKEMMHENKKLRSNYIILEARNPGSP